MVEHSAGCAGLRHVGRPSTHVRVFVKIGPIQKGVDGTKFTKAARGAGACLCKTDSGRSTGRRNSCEYEAWTVLPCSLQGREQVGAQAAASQRRTRSGRPLAPVFTVKGRHIPAVIASDRLDTFGDQDALLLEYARLRRSGMKIPGRAAVGAPVEQSGTRGQMVQRLFFCLRAQAAKDWRCCCNRSLFTRPT